MVGWRVDTLARFMQLQQMEYAVERLIKPGQIWRFHGDTTNVYILFVGNRRAFVRFGNSPNSQEDSIGLNAIYRRYELISEVTSE